MEYGNTAVPARRCEAGDVGDHAAPHTNDDVVARQTHRRESPAQ